MTRTQTDDHDDHLHDRGLAFDMQTLMARRNVLRLCGGAGVAGLAIDHGRLRGERIVGRVRDRDDVCGDPEETAGPFPGDGSNGPNILTESGVVRGDIRSSFGSSTTTATGVPMTISLTITDTASSCAPHAGAAVYLWHCDQQGRYSMYSAGVTGENYLRGVQEADASGVVKFTSIFPACYAGRWPHAHFEVYPSLDDATGGGQPVVTPQLALPQDVCATMFATDGYEQSVENLGQLSLAGDMVFSDGAARQLAAMSGDVTAGYVAALTVAV